LECGQLLLKLRDLLLRLLHGEVLLHAQAGPVARRCRERFLGCL
jgi:hypothetical protein